MSRGSSASREELVRELTRELRQFTGLGASFFRAAATRGGMTVTDLQVIDILDGSGPLTAGQLADLTGLTTGAITGMLNRLEEAGLLRRERDPNDGRRVIVQLERDKDEPRATGSMFADLGRAWESLASDYDDEQLGFLVAFLKRSNGVSSDEIVRLREAPESTAERTYSSALGDLETAQLFISSGVSRLTVRAGVGMDDLYQARFEGLAPEVTVKDGVVTLRYLRRFLALAKKGQDAADVTLNNSIPWRITIQGGALEVEADLRNLPFAGLEIKGGVNSIHLDLPEPTGAVPVRISGGASHIDVRRPVGAAARAHLKGWASTFAFDDQRFADMGSDVRLQSRDYEASAPYYDIEVLTSVSAVSITTQ